MEDQKLIDLSDLPPPPKDALEVYVHLHEEDIHYVDTIVCCYDGIAKVRRDCKVLDDKMYFKVYVPPDFLEEFKEVLERLKEFIFVGDFFIVEPQ